MKTLTLSDPAFAEVAAQVDAQRTVPAPVAPPAPAPTPPARWTSPTTGHVLPLPQVGELLPGYAMRVFAECGTTAERATQMNGVFMAGTANFHMNGDGTRPYWPGIVDEGYNREAYQTPAEKAEAAAQNANTAAAMGAIKPGPFLAATATMADANYLLAVDPYYRQHVNGQSVWQAALGGTQVEINNVIGMTGSKAVIWFIKDGPNSVEAYRAAQGPLIAIVDKLIAAGGIWPG